MNFSLNDLQRDIPKAQLYYFLTYKSENENLLDTITDCFYIRDHRHGRGERHLGRLCFNWIADLHPVIFLKIMKFIPEYGRWDDLLYITNKQIRPYIYTFIRNQLNTDRLDMAIGVPISTLAKWLPSEGKSFYRHHKTEFEQLLEHLHFTPQDYRQTLSCLRKYLELPEHIVCSDQTELHEIYRKLSNTKLSNAAKRKYSKIYNLTLPPTPKPTFSIRKTDQYYQPILTHLKI